VWHPKLLHPAQTGALTAKEEMHNLNWNYKYVRYLMQNLRTPLKMEQSTEESIWTWIWRMQQQNATDDVDLLGCYAVSLSISGSWHSEGITILQNVWNLITTHQIAVQHQLILHQCFTALTVQWSVLNYCTCVAAKQQAAKVQAPPDYTSPDFVNVTLCTFFHKTIYF